MKCLFCGSYQTKAIDTRSIKNKQIIKRRRVCLKCQQRFTTYERADKE